MLNNENELRIDNQLKCRNQTRLIFNIRKPFFFKYEIDIVASPTQFQSVEMVHMELIARITAVVTVRVIILVTKQPELALNALLDGKINIVTKVRKLKEKLYKICIVEVVKLFLI